MGGLQRLLRPDSHHVNAVLPINGGLIAAERYAIHLIGIDSGGFIVRGIRRSYLTG